MSSLPSKVHVFVARDRVDFRKGFDGLCAIVRDDLHEDPLSGHLFLFFNMRANRAKILIWDRNGFWLFYKRLERGTFERLRGSASKIEIDRARLAMLLDGIDTNKGTSRHHFVREIRIRSRADDERARTAERGDALSRLVLEVNAKLHEQQAQPNARDTQIAQRDERIAKLERDVHVLSKWAFGRRSEKRAQRDSNRTNPTWLPLAELLEPAQRVADLCDAQGTIEIHAPTDEAAKTTRTRRAQPRSEFSAHLPRVRTTFEPPEDRRVCCAKPMGVELSRELERFEIAVVHEIARTKYCCRECQISVMTAPGPTHPLARSLMGPNWLAQLLVERFGSHMPYCRLEQKHASEGLSLSRTVLDATRNSPMCRTMGAKG